MVKHDLKIRFTDHALDSLSKRGVTQQEVSQTIQESGWRSAREGRYEAEKEFGFNQEWNNKFYQTKKVNPVFVEEDDTVVVITVYQTRQRIPRSSAAWDEFGAVKRKMVRLKYGTQVCVALGLSDQVPSSNVPKIP